MSRLLHKLTSRKFLLTLFGMGLITGNRVFQVGLDDNTIIASIAMLMSFIVGESYIDAKRELKQKVNKYLSSDTIDNLRKGNFKYIFSKFCSRKFIVTVIGVFLIILNKKLNLGFDNSTIITFALIVVSFVFGESYTDAQREYGEIMAKIANNEVPKEFT